LCNRQSVKLDQRSEAPGIRKIVQNQSEIEKKGVINKVKSLQLQPKVQACSRNSIQIEAAKLDLSEGPTDERVRGTEAPHTIPPLATQLATIGIKQQFAFG